MSGKPGERTPARRRGLGMGLSALLGGVDEDGSAFHHDAGGDGSLRTVPIETIRPNGQQPRRHFAREELEALAESIRAQGVMQPLLVRPAAGALEIVAGERRWRAAQIAGLHELPVVVRRIDDRNALELALVENIQREDLTPLEEATGYRRLIDEFGHTQEELARALGKSRSHVANTLRLLGLPETVREMVEAGRLSAGHARALLSAPDPAAAARVVVEQDLNVRQTEALAKAPSARSGRKARPPENDADGRAAESMLAKRLGVPVTLRRTGDGGTLTIRCSSMEQLNRLIERLS